MAGSLNKVMILGRLGADPEIRHTQDGRPIANLRVATSESWRDKMSGEKKEKTEWHSIVIFSEGLVKVCQQYLTKGSQVYIEGQLQTRKWQDQNGQDRYTTEIVLQNYNSNLVMLGGRDNNNAPSQNYMSDNSNAAPAFNKTDAKQPAYANDLDDDIPF